MTISASPFRPLPIQIREDLSMAEHVYRGQLTWVVKDPLGNEYFQFTEQEYALLSWLKQDVTLDELKQKFERRFAPHRITYREIQSFLLGLQKKALIVATVSDRGRHLLKAGRKKKWQKLSSQLKNPLAVRWRGVDPDRFLNWVTPRLGWIFSTWAVVCGIATMFAALLWLSVHYGEFKSRLPAMGEFLAASNLGLLAAVLIFTKIFHELGHAIVFKKYGGRCHEIGVMFLVFMPTLYCNTSDSWRFPSKWRRAAVGAAGLYVELLIASIATFGWWFSHPGTFQFLCLNTMFISSVSAVLFNGNPLLKFDAYYVLSDLIEIPNLQQRSGQFVRNWFLRFGLGMPQEQDPGLASSTKWWLSTYCVCAYLYRIFLAYVIGMAVVSIFKPLGLTEAAKMFSLFVALTLLLAPVVPIIKYFKTPGRIERVKRWRATAIGALVGACALFVFCVPLTHKVHCIFTVDPAGSKSIYAQRDATLKEIHVVPGQEVRAGEMLVTLRDFELEVEMSKLQTQKEQLESRLRFLDLSRHSNVVSGTEAHTVRLQIETVNTRIEEMLPMQESLLVRAPRDGIVIPEWVAKDRAVKTEDLGRWSGSTLHPENLGARIARGQKICSVGDPGALEATLAIDQSDMKKLMIGQPVSMQLDSQRSHWLNGEIESIAAKHSTTLKASMTRKFGGRVSAKGAGVDEDSKPSAKPNSATYEARVALGDIDLPIGSGLRGHAKILVGRRTIASGVLSKLHKTFRMEM